MRFNKIYMSIFLLIAPMLTMAQSTYPVNDGDKVHYNLQIEIRESCLSGICIMVNNEGTIASSIINEFGISLIDFTYSEKKNRIKLHNIIKPLNRWYIKRFIKRSLKKMINVMKSGGTEYIDNKNKIRYFFTLNNDTQE